MVLEDLGCKVVGDDAIGATLEGPTEILTKLRNIGKIQEEKVERWAGETSEPDQGLELHTWHYVKRPITRLANHVIQGFQAVYPPAGDFLEINDGFHTVKPHPDRVIFLQQRCNQLLAFIVQFRKFPSKPTGLELETIEGFYHHCRSILFNEGKTTPRHLVSLHLLPSRVETSFDFDEWFDEFALIVTRVPREVDDEIREFDKKGLNRGPMTQALSMAVKLGFAEAKVCTMKVIPKDYRDLFHRILLKSNRVNSLYDFSIDPTCPKWLIDLIQVESSKIDPTYIPEDDLLAVDIDDLDTEM
jgi:hypothetical protein